MEGPTPVSALIHAATMVTAGVFLVIRTSFIFEFSLISLTILVYLGSLTACLFGIVGFFQYDIKKIIAFSTCSQLGYMMTACGLSGYNFAFFHLFTHAGFKALLFLSAGTFIHLTNNEQDLRKMSGVIKLSYLTCVVFIIGSLALMGFPFLSGFFSKEPIILLSFLYKSNPLIFFLIELSTCLTIMYSLKIFYYLFLKKNFNNRIFLAPTTFNLFNFLPLIILSIISLFSGYFFKTIFIGLGNNIFYGVIFTVNANVLEIEFISFFIKILPLLFLIVLNFIFYELYIIQFKQNPYLYFYNYNLFLFFNKRMFIDSLLNIFISFFFYRLSYKIFVLFDKGVLEICGPYLIVSNLFILNNIFISLLSKYFTKNVAAAVFLFFFLIFFIFFFNLFVFIL